MLNPLIGQSHLAIPESCPFLVRIVTMSEVFFNHVRVSTIISTARGTSDQDGLPLMTFDIDGEGLPFITIGKINRSADHHASVGVAIAFNVGHRMDLKLPVVVGTGDINNDDVWRVKTATNRIALCPVDCLIDARQ